MMPLTAATEVNTNLPVYVDNDADANVSVEEAESGLEADDKNLLSVPDTSNIINGSNSENGGDVENIEARLMNGIVGGERPFLCMECGRSFRTARSLRAHLRSHSDERRYQCNECGKWFRRASGRNEHIQNVHRGLRAHLCDRCPRAFTTLNGLRLHAKRHTNKTNDADVENVEAQLVDDKVVSDPVDHPVKADAQKALKLCTICGKMFHALQVHMRLHRRTSYECPDCGRTFAQRYYLSKHRHVHSSERPFLCIKCGRGFKAAGSLKAHLRSHTDERSYQCNECGKWFRRSSGRNEHIRNVHQGLKAYQCDRCPRAFSTSNGLKLHIMGHTNERPHACEMCPKRFKSVSLLNLHLGTHAGLRQFPCRVCGYRFTQRSAVRVHEATQHSEDGGRCHLCELCGQRFSRRSIRDAHVRRHTGEKPHACSMCNWTFATVGDLRNHTIKKHKVKCNAPSTNLQQLLA